MLKVYLKICVLYHSQTLVLKDERSGTGLLNRAMIELLMIDSSFPFFQCIFFPHLKYSKIARYK